MEVCLRKNACLHRISFEDKRLRPEKVKKRISSNLVQIRIFLKIETTSSLIK